MTCGQHRGSAKVVVGLAALLIATGATGSLALPAKVENIEGSELKRVMLESEAAERLHLEMTPVREEKIVLRTVVVGQVEDERVAKAAMETADSGGGALAVAPQPTPTAWGETRVLVLLDDDDDDDDDVGEVDDDDSAEIIAPADEDDDQSLLAKHVVMTWQAESDANTLYFKIPAAARHNLTTGQRVAVRLAAPGSSVAKKVIPYSAVLYDAGGNAWVYISTAPLTFVRHRVVIDKIDRGLAILQEGPDVGTKVVTVGGAELYGAESGVGH
jgi:hypothetical protein